MAGIDAMSFYRKYELARLIAEGEAKTFRAVERATGTQLFLHLFNPSAKPLLEKLKSKLLDSRGAPVAPLREIGDFAGSAYAVTELLDPFTNLEEWLSGLPDSKARSKSPEPEAAAERAPSRAASGPMPPRQATQPPPVPRPAGPPESGEVTRMLLGSHPLPPAAPAPRRSASEPGDFTRMLLGNEHSPRQSAKPPIPPAPMPPPSTPQAPPPESGEFTRMLLRAGLTPDPGLNAPPEPPPSPAAAGPGEFTRMLLGSQPLAPPVPARPGESTPAAPPPAQTNRSPEQGEFTRMILRSDASLPSSSKGPGLETFLEHSLPAEPVDVERRQAASADLGTPAVRPFAPAGEFTRMFGSPPASAGPEPAAGPSGLGLNTSVSGLFGAPGSIPAAPQPSTGGPGDYTRIIGAPEGATAAAPAASAPAAAPAGPARTGNRTAWIAASLGALLLIVIVVILFLLR